MLTIELRKCANICSNKVFAQLRNKVFASAQIICHGEWGSLEHSLQHGYRMLVKYKKEQYAIRWYATLKCAWTIPQLCAAENRGMLLKYGLGLLGYPPITGSPQLRC